MDICLERPLLRRLESARGCSRVVPASRESREPLRASLEQMVFPDRLQQWLPVGVPSVPPVHNHSLSTPTVGPARWADSGSVPELPLSYDELR